MLTIGQNLGHYTVRSAIGAGGMGEIYRARDGRLRRDVAIKILPESLTRDKSAIDRFIREAHAASALVGGDVPWSQLPAYVVGSLLGALVAAISYDLLARPRAAETVAEAEPPQGTQGDIVGRRGGDRGRESATSTPESGGRRRGRGERPR